MHLVDTNNWLNIPVDVFGHILTFCDCGIKTVMGCVSKKMRSYIENHFNWIADSQFTLREYGIKYGYPHIIGWTINPSQYEYNKIIGYIYLGGKYVDVLQPFDTVCMVAVSKNHLEMIKWVLEIKQLYKHFKHSIEEISKFATYYGSLDILQWAYKFDPDSVDMVKNTIYAIRYGHLEIFKWIITEGYVAGYREYCDLLIHGRMDMLQWMQTNDPNWDHLLCRAIAGQNPAYDHIIKWLDGIPMKNNNKKLETNRYQNISQLSNN
jgi:hypothetical protein